MTPSRQVPRSATRVLRSAAACALLGGCMVGPNYHRPLTPAPLTYKELPAPPQGWATARPDDGTDHGRWWAAFGDPTLNTLEARVNIDNQNIKQAEAAYREARALIRESRAALFPTIAADGNATRTHQDHIYASSGTGEITADWTLDIWGKVRRSVESSAAAAQVSAADLANARLSAQASVATLFYDLCYQDALETLLGETVKAYQRALTITTNQATFGVAAPSDVITARTQLEGAQAQLVQAGIARTQDEHAIAALIGVPPVDLAITFRKLPDASPNIPVSLPSVLLQRRPDIAAAERNMQAQNAQIGVAVAAYYPTISLSAEIGYTGSPLAMLFNISRQFWTIAAAGSQTLFEGGLRGAAVDAARAVYDQSVASYRQTVLSAFQQVEDQLSALRILAEQAEVQARADADAQRAVTIALNEYEAGTQNYTTVVTAQTILLGDQESMLAIQLNRLTSSISLIQALGGGWDSAELPPLR